MRKIIIRVLFALGIVLSTIMMSSEVRASAARAKINKTEITVDVGGRVKLKIKNTKKTVKWTSSDKTIARVSKKGNVYGLSKGECTVTAKVGSKTFTCKVTVTDTIGDLLDTSVEINNVEFPLSKKWEFMESVSTDELRQYNTDKTVFKCVALQGVELSVEECSDIKASEENFKSACMVIVNAFNKEFETDAAVYEVKEIDGQLLGNITGSCKMNGENVAITFYIKFTDSNMVIVMGMEIGNPTTIMDRILTRICTGAVQKPVEQETE